MKEKAILLRKTGKSYTEIAKELNVSKTIVSIWLKKYRLTESEALVLKNNIKSRIEKGRIKALISIRSKKVYKDMVLYEEAKKSFEVFIKESLFSYGLGLYEGHGTKKVNYYNFTHKDIETHRIMLIWVNKYILINEDKLKFKLFISSGDEAIEKVDFWSSNMNIPEENINAYVYKRGVVSKNKDKKDNGILSVMYNDVKVINKINAWQNMLIKYYKGV